MELNANQGSVKLHIPTNESDTYEVKTRDSKESISEKDVINHWDIRAQRPGIQAVMSTRYTPEENEKNTKKFHKSFFEFLEGYIENKKVFEVGFGIGRMIAPIAKVAKEISGCDMSPVMFARSVENLKEFDNVKLHLGKIASLGLPKESFDLTFSVTVLQHILNPQELKNTIEKMKILSDNVCIVEHTYQGPDFPISKYTILRKPEEYIKLFEPYKCIKQKFYLCGNDRFNMMFFQK